MRSARNVVSGPEHRILLEIIHTLHSQPGEVGQSFEIQVESVGGGGVSKVLFTPHYVKKGQRMHPNKDDEGTWVFSGSVCSGTENTLIFSEVDNNGVLGVS